MIRRIGTLTVLMVLVGSTTALAAPTTVTVRVEGAMQTTFEGAVTTDAKSVVQDGETRTCDGTNGGANPTPGPTATGALDDAAIGAGFTWDSTWFDGFQDFSIDRIGPDSSNSSQFWGLAINGTGASVGGCQYIVAAGDEVLWAYDYFSKAHALKLAGPAKAATGESFAVQVTQADDGANAVGASVGGQVTGADGTAQVSFDQPGTQVLKAERADSVRSNGIQVCIYRPGSGDCATVPDGPAPGPGGGGSVTAAAPDRVQPQASFTSPRFRSYRFGPRLLSGTVEESGSLHQVYLRLRKIGRGGCRWFSFKRETFTNPKTCERARFGNLGTDKDWSYLLPERLGRGRYILEVKAVDTAFNWNVLRTRFRVREG